MLSFLSFLAAAMSASSGGGGVSVVTAETSLEDAAKAVRIHRRKLKEVCERIQRQLTFTMSEQPFDIFYFYIFIFSK